MALKFPGAWRFAPPQGGAGTTRIPAGAVDEFFALIKRTATQGNAYSFLEHFKSHFCSATGNARTRSSDTSWAETDLYDEMRTASENPPLFIEAFFEGCEAIRNRSPELFAPDAEMINSVLQKHGIRYRVDPPNLMHTDAPAPLVSVSEAPPTLEEQSLDLLQRSLHRAEELLAEGRDREAVQETLWVLETAATAFRGLETESGSVEGRYFNTIVKELRAAHHGTTLNRALEWASGVHGFLSSPTGGGVRHGLDLRHGLELSPSEARLFCNLIRSFVNYLLAEHQRLSASA